MTRFAVLLDTPIHGDSALAEFTTLHSPGDGFHVVVPARSLSLGEHEMVSAEETPEQAETLPDEIVAARWRLRTAVSALQTAGIENVDGDVYADNSLDAIDEALEIGSFDKVIVVAEPAGVAGWVKLDLPSRVDRHVDEPVIVVEIESTDT